MHNKFSYCTATASDCNLLSSLAEEIWHLHYPSIISLHQIEYMLDLMYSKTAIAQDLRDGGWWVILEYEKKKVGFMACAMIEEAVCKIQKLYVHPDWQRKGIGKHAINLALDYARKNAASMLTLNVNRKNINSILAYKATGFVVDREENNKLGPYLLDDYVMSQKV